MRLKLILGAFLGLLTSVCYAVCDPNPTNTYTTNTGLVKPPINACGWGLTTNGNWDIADSSFAALSRSNIFTSTNTFNYPVLLKGQPLRFYDATTHYVEFQAPSSVTTTHFSLPSADGSSGQFMRTDGAGNLSFGSASGGGGSSSLAVNKNGTVISSPTVAINILSPPLNVVLTGGSTAQITVDYSSVTVQGNSFNQANQLVKLDSSARLPVVDGSLLTNIAPVTNYTQSFTAQTSVILTHNSNTTNIVVACYDNSVPPLYIGFNTLAVTNNNNATVTFSTSQTGNCVVSTSGGGGGDNLGNHNATKGISASYGITASTVSVSTITLTGDILYSDGNSMFLQGGAGGKNVYVGYTTRNNASIANALAAVQNTALGYNALFALSSGVSNTAIGEDALNSVAGTSGNTAVGATAGITSSGGTNNTFIGSGSDAVSSSLGNATAIGAGAVVQNSNVIQMGAISGAQAAVVNGSTLTFSSGTVTTLYVSSLTARTGIIGNAGTAACTGCIGEVISSTTIQDAYALTSTQYRDAATVTLTPGCWMLFGNVSFDGSGTTGTQNGSGGISTTSGNSTTGLVLGANQGYGATQIAGQLGGSVISIVYPQCITSQTQYYLKVQAVFGSGSSFGYGALRGVRVN